MTKERKRKEKERKVWNKTGNFIHAFFLLFLGAYAFRAVVCVDTGLYDGNLLDNMLDAFCQAGITEIFTFIGALAFILFGIVGIYEFGYLNGLFFLTPPVFVKIKEANYMKQAEKMMRVYYEKDIDFIWEYEKQRTDYMLQTMGIDEKQFRHINYEIIKARTKPEKTLKELKQKAESVILQKDFIVKRKGKISEWVYDKVDYSPRRQFAFGFRSGKSTAKAGNCNPGNRASI